MQLIDEIVELAVDDSVPLPVVLRKCLVVATRLKNEHLKQWVLGELNGFEDKDALPDYRVIRIQAKGHFVGSFQREVFDQPLHAAAMKEEHRWWATTAYLMQGVAAYEQLISNNTTGRLRADWPADLVAFYQTKFFTDKDLALNRAWQEIPLSGIAGLVDTVRNRLLAFALELQSEIGDADVPLDQLPRESVDNKVTTIIYGGQNVIAGSVAGDVKQIGQFNVAPGDFDSLARVLGEVGLPAEELTVLQSAIAEDKEAGEEKGFGARTSEWLDRALASVGKGGGEVVGDVAKALLTKAMNAYFGLE